MLIYLLISYLIGLMIFCFDCLVEPKGYRLREWKSRLALVILAPVVVWLQVLNYIAWLVRPRESR